MKTKILGRTGLEVTIIGLGTIYIGSQPSGPLRDLDEEMGARAVQAAIEAGCTLVDTAPLYGGTTVEKIVGDALREPSRPCRQMHRRHQNGCLPGGGKTIPLTVPYAV